MSEDANTRTRLAILIGFLLAFGGLFGAGWLLFAQYVAVAPIIPQILADKNADGQWGKLWIVWPGVAVFLQNIFIFARYVINYEFVTGLFKFLCVCV